MMAESKELDLGKLLDPKRFDLEIRSSERPEELQSRLRLAEAEEAHRRRKDLLVHAFVMAVTAITFLFCLHLVLSGHAQSDKAMGLITVIVSAGVGFLTGKGMK